MNYCPSLLLNDNNECVEEPIQQKCFEFNTIQLPDGVTASSLAPKPIYERGLWFDGTSVLILHDLILNTHFTVEIYIKSESGGHLFSVIGSTPEWTLQHYSGKLELRIDSRIAHIVDASQDEWHQVAVTMFLGQAYLTVNTNNS